MVKFLRGKISCLTHSLFFDEQIAARTVSPSPAVGGLRWPAGQGGAVRTDRGKRSCLFRPGEHFPVYRSVHRENTQEQLFKQNNKIKYGGSRCAVKAETEIERPAYLLEYRKIKTVVG